jgi:dipeptidyl aminopeptidase/acylaminoacyl peptidase
VVHPDGSGLRRLVRDADDWRWSPKEDVLAYTHANDLFRVNVDGTQRKPLTSRGCCWLVTPAPAWSPDGRRIAYLRSVRAKGVRDPLAHDQIWVMNADGTEKRPVTRPFPDGGTNEFPRWVEGQVRAAQPQRALRLVSLPRRSVLRTAVPVGGLAAEGRRAAVEQGLGGGTEYPNRPGPLLVWEPDRGRVLRLPIRDCGSVLELVSAGRRLAYTCDNSGTDVLDQALRLVRLPGGRTHKVVRAVATHLRAPAGTRLRGLVGEGRLLAFALGRLVLLPHGGGWLNARTDIFSSGRKVASWRGEAQLVDADAEHVVVKLGQRAVVVVSGDGRTVRRFSFGRNQARGAAVDGRRLAVLLRGRLVVYDAGRRRASWPVVRGFGPPPVLEDVEGDLAVYVAGVAIHLVRLTDGRDIVIRIPHEAGPAFAELVPAGLFYAYNVAYSKPPGRVAFVTRADLLRALR